MPTSTYVTKNKDGFSLLEILVALFLVVLIFTVVSVGNFTARQHLDETLDNLERTARFGVDEAALRNAIIRLHFFLDKIPQEYALEFGPNDSFILPESYISNTGNLNKTLSEQQDYETQIKKINKQFNRIKEFQDGNKKIHEAVKVIGVGTTLYKELITEFHSSIYIYPTGEKDGAIIILGTEEEMASISIDPFTMDISRTYYELDEYDLENINEVQYKKAVEIFKEWLRK